MCGSAFTGLGKTVGEAEKQSKLSLGFLKILNISLLQNELHYALAYCLSD